VNRSAAFQNPDLNWYREISERKFLREPRCPFASVEKCPRFYQSLSLLGTAGSTAIDKSEDERLLKKWETHYLWPKTAEQETAIFSSEERPFMYSRFCPEVLFERFGLFVSELAEYADGVDRDSAQRALDREGAATDSWQRRWPQLTPMHYSDCPIFSTLLHDPGQAEPEHRIFGWTLSFHGLSIDLKEAWLWIKRKLAGR
jgi:hypothetical protein